MLKHLCESNECLTSDVNFFQVSTGCVYFGVFKLQATENVSKNTMLEYVMINSVFETIIQVSSFSWFDLWRVYVVSLSHCRKFIL